MKRLILFLSLFLVIGCQQKILDSDDFTQADVRKWWLEEDGFGRTFIANGQLFVEVNQANAVQYATLRDQEFSDFSVQVEGTLVSGSDNSSYGVIFRKQPQGAFYRFAVTGNGAWSVDRRDASGGWVRLTPSGRWENAEIINQGIGLTNRLRVTTLGNIVVFEINDQVVHRSESFDTSFFSGTLALSTSTLGQAGTRVAFDNFVVREP